MSRTFLRQETQIRNSDLYDDTLAFGTGLEIAVNSGNVEQDLNGLRSQVKRILGTADWWTDVFSRSLSAADQALAAFESKPILCGTQVLTNVTVGNGDNFVVLSVAGSEAPTNTAGVGAAGLGTVVAVLGAAELGTHQLTVEAGQDALTPLNLVHIRDAATRDGLTSGGQQVFGLMQAEIGTAQDDAFNDTDRQVQISFVRANGDALEAVPVVDIEDRVIEYVYGRRIQLKDIPQDCGFPNINFVDSVGVVDVVRKPKVYAVVTTNVNEDVDVGGAAGGANLDAQLPDMSGGNFLTNYDVFVNGRLDRPGADASANNDYYPGTALALGQLRFEYKLKAGDVICVVPYQS